MAESKLKLELPCPRCGMLNGPTALRCRQCAHELETASMPDWPQPAPFDLPGVIANCPNCGMAAGAGADVCGGCGGPLGAAQPEPETAKSARLRPRPRRKVGPIWLKKAGVANLVWLARLLSALFLIWSVVDSGVWLNGITRTQAISDVAATRYTTHAIYELVRNCVLVAALWLLTMPRPAKDS
jgi:hypothetical protein